MTTTRRRRSPPPPPPLPVGSQEVPAPLSGSASPSLTGALEHEVPVAEHEVHSTEVLAAEQVVSIAEQPVPAPVVAEPPPAAKKVVAPSKPVPAPQPQAETAEIAVVRTRYPHPLFIASQHKVVSPGEEVPVIVDSWVRHHLNHPNGALVRV